MTRRPADPHLAENTGTDGVHGVLRRRLPRNLSVPGMRKKTPARGRSSTRKCLVADATTRTMTSRVMVAMDAVTSTTPRAVSATAMTSRVELVGVPHHVAATAMTPRAVPAEVAHHVAATAMTPRVELVGAPHHVVVTAMTPRAELVGAAHHAAAGKSQPRGLGILAKPDSAATGRRAPGDEPSSCSSMRGRVAGA